MLFHKLNGIENTLIFKNWLEHQERINNKPTEFAEGRLSNTSVDQVRIFTRGNGCVICGGYSNHHATTTLSSERTTQITLSLCDEHILEVKEYETILSFLGSLFYLNIDLPGLKKFDRLPNELIPSISEVISEQINAKLIEKVEEKNGWKLKFQMEDGWYWILRLRSLYDYAYMLFDQDKKQRHRIDSADHHPEVPYGPAHQHYNSTNKKKHRIEPSFTYGIPFFDFPLLIQTREKYETREV